MLYKQESMLVAITMTPIGYLVCKLNMFQIFCLKWLQCKGEPWYILYLFLNKGIVNKCKVIILLKFMLKQFVVKRVIQYRLEM